MNYCALSLIYVSPDFASDGEACTGTVLSFCVAQALLPVLSVLLEETSTGRRAGATQSPSFPCYSKTGALLKTECIT